jgi:dolichol-phosphate mannosyltransferase
MISVVMGLYNEQEVLPSLISTFFKDIRLKEDFELILVDDGSTDNSKNLVLEFRKKHPQIKLISYTPNRGLGNALRTGFKHAKGRVIVTMDSDLAHPPKYIHELVETLDKGYDMVIGSRYAPGGQIADVPSERDFLSKFTNFITRFAIMSDVRDQTTNFRAYNPKILRKISTSANGFEVEVELLVKFLRANAQIKEVPVRSTVDRLAGQSKFSLLRHSIKYAVGLLRVIFYRWI